MTARAVASEPIATSEIVASAISAPHVASADAGRRDENLCANAARAASQPNADQSGRRSAAGAAVRAAATIPPATTAIPAAPIATPIQPEVAR